MAGKKRSSANSYKHGLSTPEKLVLGDKDLIKQLAASFAGANTTAGRLMAAEQLAQAELEVIRLGQIKGEIIDAAIAKLRNASNSKVGLAEAGLGADKSLTILRGYLQALPALTKIARYEGRIWERHRRARCHWAITSGE